MSAHQQPEDVHARVQMQFTQLKERIHAGQNAWMLSGGTTRTTAAYRLPFHLCELNSGEASNSTVRKIWEPSALQAVQWPSFWILDDTVDRSPEQPDRTSHNKLGGKDPRMESWLVTCHHTKRDTTLDDRLGVPQSVFRTVLPADAKNAEDLEFDETDEITNSQTKKYKVHMSVRITSNVLRQMLSVVNNRARQNRIFTSSISFKGLGNSRLIHNMTPKSSSTNLVHLIGRFMAFFQLGNLHCRSSFVSWTIFQYRY